MIPRDDAGLKRQELKERHDNIRAKTAVLKILCIRGILAGFCTVDKGLAHSLVATAAPHTLLAPLRSFPHQTSFSTCRVAVLVSVTAVATKQARKYYHLTTLARRAILLHT